tara:strand:- start:100 stop:249 length:150 start_codon:yes stop_codon:yes gene_type:complete
MNGVEQLMVNHCATAPEPEKDSVRGVIKENKLLPEPVAKVYLRAIPKTQ